MEIMPVPSLLPPPLLGKFILKPYLLATLVSNDNWVGVRVMVSNTTFNNISVTCISWRTDLLVEETGVPSENHRPATIH
jgi:hypothetical protein